MVWRSDSQFSTHELGWRDSLATRKERLKQMCVYETGPAGSIVVNPTWNTIDPFIQSPSGILAPANAGNPNRIGFRGMPTGTDHSPIGWSVDTAYPDGAANVAFINTGHDNVCNQIGAQIDGDHCFIKYHPNGHSRINGGSYVVVTAARANGYGLDLSLRGDGSFSGDCWHSDISGDHAAGLTGKFIDVSGIYSVGSGYVIDVSGNYSVGVGRNIDVDHHYATVVGCDAQSIADGSLTVGAAKIQEHGDNTWSKVVTGEKTSDGSWETIGRTIDLPTDQVSSKSVRVALLATRDGGSNGHNDDLYGQALFEGEFTVLYDGTNQYGYVRNAGGQHTYRPLQEQWDDIGITQLPRLRLTTSNGKLAVQVKGQPFTDIVWNVDYEVSGPRFPGAGP
jgi:hypothetical protein